MSFFTYVTSELTHGYKLEREKEKYSEKRERVYSFMKTPRALENFLLYGFFQCADAFLFTFTLLPLRIMSALIRIITHPAGLFNRGSRRLLAQSQICDVLKGFILICTACLLTYIDTSMLYHIIRGQSVIKLYIFFNMLELADKLFSTFGQDILDSLFWTAMEPRGRKREHFGVIPHLLLAIIYVTMHTLLFLLQMTTLSVAFNSHSKSLLTIMMSNNFVEIKSNVFRRMDKNNLFQMTCSDAKERFYYVILLFLVLMRNMTEFSWDLEHFWVVLPDALLPLMAEILVDWFKHAFVTKFNEINSDVYYDFTASLAKDITANRQKSAFTDQSDLVSRRMTFTPLPLACLVIRMFSKTLRISGLIPLLSFITGFLCLLTFKIITSICLLGHAASLLQEPCHGSSAEQMPKQQPTDTSESKHQTAVRSYSLADSRSRDVAHDAKYVEDILSGMALLSSSSVSLNSLVLHDDLSQVKVVARDASAIESLNCQLSSKLHMSAEDVRIENLDDTLTSDDR